LALVIVGSLGLTRIHSGRAAWNVNPPVQPGFPQVLSGAAIYESSPTLADLDGDATTLEIIVAGRDRTGETPNCQGRVYAYRPNGALYWEQQVRAPVNSTPAVADVDHDGVPEVVVGLGGYIDKTCWNGGVTALNGHTGAIEWTFDTQDWLNHSPDGWRDGVYSSPAIGDVNDDGDLEIVVGAWDQCIYLLGGAGNPLWPELNGIVGRTYCGGHGFYNEDTVWSSASLADLDGDGTLEIIIGADITAGNQNGDPTGGYVYILRHDGEQLAREWLDQAIYSSPAVGDVDNDGQLEIVVGTGTYLKNKGYYVRVFNYNPSGAAVTDRLVEKWTLATDGRVFSSPALGDLNTDGYLDIVAVAAIGDGPEQGGANAGSKVFGWSGQTGAKLFETQICDSFGNHYTTHTSPSIAAVGRDGDSGLKILFGHSWEIGILNSDGSYYTDSGPCYDNETTNITYWTNYSTYGTPASGDIDHDGKVEVVIANGQSLEHPNVGVLHVWEPGMSTGGLPWPMFRQNPRHSGGLLFPALAVSPANLSIPFISGQTPAAQQIVISNATAGTSFEWSAAINWSGSEVANWFTLSALSGAVSRSAQVSLAVNAAATADPGTYQAVITIAAEDAKNSPQQITVQYVVPPPTLFIRPSEVLFLLAPEEDSDVRNIAIKNAGGGGPILWTAAESLSWLYITPESGDTKTQPHLVLEVDSSGLGQGYYSGVITVHATTAGVSNPDQTIAVALYYGPLTRVYTPLVLRDYAPAQ